MEEKSKMVFEEEKSVAIDLRKFTFLGSRILFILLVAIHVLWFVLGLAKIIIGALHTDDCDLEQMIPIWLIVDGLIPCFFVTGFVPHCTNSSDAFKKYGIVCLVIAAILSIGWSICGGVFIYPNWNAGGACNTVVAIFAFVSITINWSVIHIWSQLVIRLIFFQCCQKNFKTCPCPETQKQQYVK